MKPLIDSSSISVVLYDHAQKSLPPLAVVSSTEHFFLEFLHHGKVCIYIEQTLKNESLEKKKYKYGRNRKGDGKKEQI